MTLTDRAARETLQGAGRWTLEPTQGHPPHALWCPTPLLASPRMYERRKPWAWPELEASEWKKIQTWSRAETKAGGMAEPQSRKASWRGGAAGPSMSQSREHWWDSSTSKLRKLLEQRRLQTCVGRRSPRGQEQQGTVRPELLARMASPTPCLHSSTPSHSGGLLLSRGLRVVPG